MTDEPNGAPYVSRYERARLKAEATAAKYAEKETNRQARLANLAARKARMVARRIAIGPGTSDDKRVAAGLPTFSQLVHRVVVLEDIVHSLRAELGIKP